ALAINDEDRAAGHARVAGDVVATHAVVGHHLALEIADEVKRQPAKLLGERLVREDGVDADRVDPDTVRHRIFVPGPKLGQLGPSTTGEIQHVEKEHECSIFLERIAKGELLAPGGRQLEVGRLVAYLQHVKKSIGSPGRTSRSASRL